MRITYTLHVHPEDMPVRGNVMASGDDELDKRVEDEIIDRLNRGDDWAWCTVEIRAEYRGLIGAAFLGGCTYDSERDFVENSGYYEDLCHEARQNLLAEIDEAIQNAVKLQQERAGL
jgi:hypothetical protein